jgi:hypothetical protein
MIFAVHLLRTWRLSFAGLVAVVLSITLARGARACECSRTTVLLVSAADLLANHAAIFEGRVVGPPEPPEPPPHAPYQERLAALQAKIEQMLGAREVQLDVLRSWKGAAEHAVVRTQGQRTACGYPFELGRTYLVFADRGEDGALWVSSCGRTRPSGEPEAEADRALLDTQGGGPTATAAPRRAGCAGCAVAYDAGTGGIIRLTSVLFLAVVRGRRRRGPPASRERLVPSPRAMSARLCSFGHVLSEPGLWLPWRLARY